MKTRRLNNFEKPQWQSSYILSMRAFFSVSTQFGGQFLCYDKAPYNWHQASALKDSSGSCHEFMLTARCHFQRLFCCLTDLLTIDTKDTF